MFREVTGGYKKTMTRPYEKLVFYQNICDIRRFIFIISERFSKQHMRLVSQMRDAARSAKQNIKEGYRRGTLAQYKNIKEGYRRGTLAQYIQYIKISLASLEELSGDMEDCFEDYLISKEEYEHFLKLYRSADFLMCQYLKSMYKIENQGRWKVPGELKRLRVRKDGC